MKKEEIEPILEKLVSSWVKNRFRNFNNLVEVSPPGIKTLARDIEKHCLEMEGALASEKGIDSHKVAASMAYALTTSPWIVLKPSPMGWPNTPKPKQQVATDCALTIFLSFLNCNQELIENEAVLWSHLRYLFSDIKHVTLFSLSMLGYLLEKNFPYTAPAA